MPMHLSLPPSLSPLFNGVCNCKEIYPSHFQRFDWAFSNKSLFLFIWMGRVKLKIKRLESSTSRLTTYSKRKNGLIKKANELSVLCDIDIALLMFSPSGRPVLWKGKNSGIEGIIERYAELTPQERAKRKLESFDALKRSYSKSDHTVNLQDFFGTRCQTTGDLMAQANLMRTNLSEIQKRLSDWNNPDKIDSLEILEQMEDYVRELLYKIRRRKENTGNQQFWEVGCTYQIPNGTHLPFSLGVDQQVCHFPSVQNDDSQHTISPKEPNFLLRREAEFSAGYSVGNCAGFFGTVEKVENSSRGQECGIMSELLRTESLRNELIGLKTETLRNGFSRASKAESLKNQLMKTDYSRIESISSEFLAHELVKTESLMNELIKAESMRNELMKSESLRNEFIKTESLRNELRKTESLRNELMEAESFKLQLYEGYSHPNKQHSSNLPDKNLQQAQQINLQLSIDDYCAEGNFETPESGYGCNQHNLASSSGNSAVATFDEYLYTQQHFLPEGLVAEEPGPLPVNPTNQLRLTK